MRVEPSGQVRSVGVDDLFFSTTDRKGVIEGANSVFSRLAAFPRDELLGAPHNIIRHPEMPGGAFAVMWDLLLSGRPVGAYVKNLAKDGATYWVFATITPLGDKFLSVRTSPGCRPLWDAASTLYDSVLLVERQARAGGASRHGAAAAGADALAAGIADLGFVGYEAFVRAALPMEVAARAAHSRLSARRPGTTGQLAVLLDSVDGIDGELTGLLARLDGFQQLAEALAVASDEASVTIRGLRAATDMASRASAAAGASAPVLGTAAGAMAVRCRETSESIEVLSEQLRTVREWLLELRFRISLARLHNDVVTSFVLEVLDGEAPPEGLTYIPQLCAALQEGIETVADDMARVATTLRAASDDVEGAGRRLGDFQRLTATWRLLVPRYQMSQQLDPYVAPIDGQLRVGHRQVAALRDLAVRCVAEALPFDPRPLLGSVAQVERVSRDLARLPPSER